MFAGKRKRKQPSDPGDPPYEHAHTRMELDSHADTTALGRVCYVMNDNGRTVTVEGFGESIGSLDDVKIVTAAVAYDCPSTFKTYILIFHEALYIPEMETHLVNPFQVRARGLAVNEIPLQQIPVEERTMESHSILERESGLHIPMSIRGTMSGWTARKPTWKGIFDPTNSQATYVHMTNSTKWKPSSSQFNKVEQSLRADLERGHGFYQKEPRDISDIGTMHARGQIGGEAAVVDAMGAGVVAAGDSTVENTGPILGGNAPEQKSGGSNGDDSALVDNNGASIYSSERPVTLNALWCNEQDYSILGCMT